MQNSVAPGTAQKPLAKKRKRRAKVIAWTLAGVFAFCLVALGASAFVAKMSVDTMMAEATGLVDDAGDAAKTEEHVDTIVSAAHRAHWATAHPIWRAAEVLPSIGDDVRAVRLLAQTADSLVSDVVAPLLEFELSSIGPEEGALNVDAIEKLGKTIEQVAPAAQDAQIRLLAQGIETEALLPPLQEPVKQVEDVLDTAADALRRLAILSPRLPDMLGARTPANYLVLVQNNAEMRTLGGNPGSVLMLTVDKGRMSITQTANQSDLRSGRAEPIRPLNPWTEALYTDRVGKFIQDTTMTPDFTQTAYLARAFWEDAIGDPGTGVLAIDPVALSYLLKATGPVEVLDGTKLTADNAVAELLSNVYHRFPTSSVPDTQAQDAFFASAAGAIFEKLTSSADSPAALFQQLARGYNEGRILFASSDPLEAKAVAGTRFNGPLYEKNNENNTVLGVFVNDNTEGKLDYYADMSVSATSDVCSANENEDKSFTVEAEYRYHVQPDEVASLPNYVSPARFFPRGVKSTNLVFYGPIGSSFVSAKVDGRDFVPQAGTNDLGRQAVLINFESLPASIHTVEVTFSSPPGAYGSTEIRTTPMIKKVPVDVAAAKCD